MSLNEQDQLIYLANVIFVANADGSVSTEKLAALDEIRASISAKKNIFEAAKKLALSENYSPSILSGFSIQVRNLADILYMCAIDGALSTSETNIIQDLSKKVHLTEEQAALLTREAIYRSSNKSRSRACHSCGTDISGDARFCPKCGSPLAIECAPEKQDFEIPTEGYAIEFCESTSASFPDALKLARASSSFKSTLRNKKTWYLASWLENDFNGAIRLAEALSGLRNKKCYHNGTETQWDELFGFTWCASERNKAYRQNQYCFGKEDNQLNPWGCKQARMDWTEWAQWFSYGRFETRGVLGRTRVWVFDKARIQHEVSTSIHRYRFCPFLRMNLIVIILRMLPNEVEVIENGPWKFNRSYNETPGSIKIVEIEKSDGMEFRQEYFSDGVRPKGIGILPDLLQKAFSEAGIRDVKPNELVR